MTTILAERPTFPSQGGRPGFRNQVALSMYQVPGKILDLFLRNGRRKMRLSRDTDAEDMLAELAKYTEPSTFGDARAVDNLEFIR